MGEEVLGVPGGHGRRSVKIDETPWTDDALMGSFS